jgi:hypothetical protein
VSSKKRSHDVVGASGEAKMESSGLGRGSGLLFSFDLEALDRPKAKMFEAIRIK